MMRKTTMFSLLGALLLGLTAQSAQALSCVPWGITDGYLHAAQSEDDYNVLKGRLTFDQRKLDRQIEAIRKTMGGRGAHVVAQFQGTALGTNGFTIPANLVVTLKVDCIAQWCPSVTSGREVILFAKKVGDQLEVSQDACSGDIYGLEDEVEQDVLACHRGQECLPMEEQWRRHEQSSN